MDTQVKLAGEAHELLDRAEQIGLDKAARLVAGLLNGTDPEQAAEGYRDGVEDALCTLIQAGATDPR